MARSHVVLGYVLTVIYLVTGCHGECPLKDDPTVSDVREFIQCMNRQIYDIENQNGDVTTKETKRDGTEFDNFLFALRFEEMEDFPYCKGMHPEQCFTLLRFLDKLTDAQVLDQIAGVSVRTRRSYNTDSLQQLLMSMTPGRIHPETRKNLQENMQWALEKGRGSSQSRWGRSVPSDPAQFFARRLSNGRELGKPLRVHTDAGRQSEAVDTSLGGKFAILRRKRQMSQNMPKLPMSSELQDIVAKFKSWRQQHGYGKSQGRWG